MIVHTAWCLFVIVRVLIVSGQPTISLAVRVPTCEETDRASLFQTYFSMALLKPPVAIVLVGRVQR